MIRVESRLILFLTRWLGRDVRPAIVTAVGLIIGVVCVWLLGLERYASAVSLCAMGCLTGFFIIEDIYIDFLYEDARWRITHEAWEWENT